MLSGLHCTFLVVTSFTLAHVVQPLRWFSVLVAARVRSWMIKTSARSKRDLLQICRYSCIMAYPALRLQQRTRACLIGFYRMSFAAFIACVVKTITTKSPLVTCTCSTARLFLLQSC